MIQICAFQGCEKELYEMGRFVKVNGKKYCWDCYMKLKDDVGV